MADSKPRRKVTLNQLNKKMREGEQTGNVRRRSRDSALLHSGNEYGQCHAR